VSELPSSVTNLIVIDGTWRQAKQMLKEIKNLDFIHVKIKNQKTRFWRFQNLSENYLATIEAIYYFFVEYYEAFESDGKAYDGRYDDLLFYFKLNYDLIQDYYNKNRQKQFTRQHALADSFISYREDLGDASCEELGAPNSSLDDTSPKSNNTILDHYECLED
jgi:DTW domain-containing protein YfiP